MTKMIAVLMLVAATGCAGFQAVDRSGRTFSCVPNDARERRWGNEPKAGERLVALPDALSEEWASRAPRAE